MNRWVSCLAALVIFAVCGLGSASAQKEPRPGTVIVPPTNVELPQDIGVRSHTNFLIFVPAAKKGSAHPYFGGTSPSGETPGSLACIYQTVTEPNNVSPACAISSATTVPSGGTNAIAIVDAYDYPTAQQDFDTFSTQFGLLLSTDTCADGKPCFTKVYAAGSQPRSNCGWAQEAALDIEWAHAMAPNAQIILVEAASNSNADLMVAVQAASNLVANAGGGEVSMSWGSNEFSGESNYDSDFTVPKVTYVASSGDSGGKVIWPSSSPNVVSAGGTSVNRGSNGNFINETVWSSAGGGPSKIEPWPGYQSDISSLTNLLQGFRGTPDISFDADPYTGVSVYDSTRCQGMSGWLVFGGTSVSAPSLSGIFNLSGDFSGNNSIQTNLYGNYSSVSSGGQNTYTNPFFDVTSGSAGNYSATNDWDFASGIGTLRGLSGLATSSTTSSPSFSLSASPSSVSVTQGSATPATSDISMTASGGFSGTVDLTASAPSGSGLTVSPSSGSISGTQKFTLSVGAGTAQTGTYTVTVDGTGTDSSGKTLTSSTTISVTVTQSSSGGGSFSLSATPGNVTLHGGGTATYSITVTPSGGFDQAVSFGVTGAPSNATNIGFSPSMVTGSGSTTLSLTVPSGTKGSNYTLTITASASGVPPQSVSVGLKIR